MERDSATDPIRNAERLQEVSPSHRSRTGVAALRRTDAGQPNSDGAWRTAAVLDRGAARTYIGRLAHQSIDHVIEQEGREYRVRVKRADLETALALRIDNPASRTATSLLSSHAFLRILIAIPVGAAAGAVVSTFMMPRSGFSQALPPLLAILAVVLTEAIWRSKPKLN